MTELAAVSAVAVLSTVALCFSLLRLIRQEREAASVERLNLCRRIQSPQAAAAMDYNESVQPGPSAIDMSDGPMGDESYWLSREELAEKLAEEEQARG